MSSNLEWIREKYGSPMSVFSSLGRAMLIASPGCDLFCADFASVEARLAFWVAEHEEGLQAFREDRKLYEEMAAETFGMLVEEVEKDSLERFVGKELILGCFESDTKVLTTRGWVCIIEVRSNDLLWDGVEWVKHTGVIFKGEKQTIRLAGIGVTPDHLVLTQDDWVPAFRVGQGKETHLISALELARSTLEGINLARVAGLKKSESPVYVIPKRFTQLTGKWIGKMLIAGMSPEISDSSHIGKTQTTKDQLIKCKRNYPVYDVTNVGPRNRFMVLTDEGPIIVHNCQYGLGWAKFLKNCHQKGMKKVTPEIAKKAIHTYRQVHWPIPALWKNIEAAAARAIMKPGSVHKLNKVAIYVSGNFLNIKLPSGRRLRYFKPRLSQKQLAGGRMVPQIHYWGMDHHQWSECVIWGGIFTNHIVQGIARDLMVNGIFNIENAGYDFLLSIHDEGLAEHAEGKGNLKEFVGLMTKLPSWADGAPITANGWTGKRYRKG